MLGCSTRISVPDLYRDGRTQLTLQTTSHPRKKGIRKYICRRRITSTYCCRLRPSAGFSSNSCSISLPDYLPKGRENRYEMLTATRFRLGAMDIASMSL